MYVSQPLDVGDKVLDQSCHARELVAFFAPAVVPVAALAGLVVVTDQRVVVLDPIGFKLKLASELQHLFTVNSVNTFRSRLSHVLRLIRAIILTGSSDPARRATRRPAD